MTATLNNHARRIQPVNDDAHLDRLPPHSIEAEQGVLGCILLNPNEILPDAIERFTFGDAFYDLRHRELFSHMRKLYEQHRPVDLLTLHERLTVGDKVESAGGWSYVTSLPDEVPSAANFSSYADIVSEKYRMRRMIQACSEAIARLYEFTGDDLDTALASIEQSVLAAGEERTADWMKPIAHHLKVLAERLDPNNYARGKGVVTGLPTGFAHLDKFTGGLHPGEMIVIAAEPSKGKTSLALNLIDHIAVRCGVPVGLFTMEMTGEQVALRMVVTRARADLLKVRTGFASKEELQDLQPAISDLAAAPIMVDESSGLDEFDLRARSRRMVKRAGCRLIVIDYLQLARSRKAKDNFERITNVSETCKAIAKDNRVPVVVVSQFNRDKERRHRKPELSDLRGSGSIEQDADVVMMLYEPSETREIEDPVSKKKKTVRVENKNEDPVWRVNLLIAKQRDGPRDWEVHLVFRRDCTRFEDRYEGTGKTSRDVIDSDNLRK